MKVSFLQEYSEIHILTPFDSQGESNARPFTVEISTRNIYRSTMGQHFIHVFEYAY